MKSFLLILFCLFSSGVFAKKAADSTHLSDFTVEKIKFSSEGISLDGAIFKPRHPYAALVIVHGSGQEKKMAEMASLLARNGIAVLTYDKRGVGESGGIYAGPEVGTNNIDDSNLNLLALDASAAANVLLANLPAKHGPLGLMGFSQAGWVIPLAAKKNSHINFMVLFSGPVVTTLEQLRFQFYTQSKPNFWETHTEAEARGHVLNDPDKYQFTVTDPRDALGKLSIPGLWIYGGRDVQVPVVFSIENLNVLQAKGKQYETRLFPELGHNTASSKSQEPVKAAVKWIRDLSNGLKNK